MVESGVSLLSPLAAVVDSLLSELALDNELGVEFVVSVSVDSVLSLELSGELCVVLISLAVEPSLLLLSPEALVIEEAVVPSEKNEKFLFHRV